MSTPSIYINDPQPWRDGAEEIRALVADLDDERSKQKMLRIADEYEHHAKRAEDYKKGTSPRD
jgi:hypothetical protein